MCTRLGEVRAAMATLVGALDPDSVPLGEAGSLWSVFDAVERLATAAKTLLARRVEESLSWQRAGYRSAAEYLAARSGSSVGEARRSLDTSAKVATTPVVQAALRRGALSAPQAGAVVDAAAANPGAEARLVAGATNLSLTELRSECARVKAAADPDPDATYKRIHAERRLRTWCDAEGAWNLVARGPVDAGARLTAALEPLIDARFAEARAKGEREAREAYAFDALAQIAQREGPALGRRRRGTHPRFLALVRVDLEALVRGAVAGEERCELTGLGPVPVRVARELLGESVLKLVLTRGTDVASLTHLGRGPTAAQRLALLWRSPTCGIEGCNSLRVEADHRIPWAQSRHTRLDELDALCKHHHDLKTYEGWEVVADRSGGRAMVPPEDPRHRRHRATADRGPPQVVGCPVECPSRT